MKPTINNETLRLPTLRDAQNKEQRAFRDAMCLIVRLAKLEDWKRLKSLSDEIQRYERTNDE